MSKETVKIHGRTDKHDSEKYHDTKQVIMDSNDPGYVNRVLVATPSIGTVRMEWVMARYGQIIPMNWSMVQYVQFMNSFAPLRYTIPDAQNLIVKETIEKNFEWLLLIEHDNILPPDAFVRFNEYMRDKKYPVVSGLYFSKSDPSEPLVFRGRGTSVYMDWKMGDKVWVDGVPTGCLLIHGKLLKSMWDESPEYRVGSTGQLARRVFDIPQKLWYDEHTHQVNAMSGTTDLEWCTKIMKGGYLEKSGWTKFSKKRYPFLIDTNIFCKHIAPDGRQYPPDELMQEPLL